MTRLLGLFIFLLAAVVSCTSVEPTRDVLTPLASKDFALSWEDGARLFRQGRPEDEAQALPASKLTFLEICDPDCTLPGLYGEEVERARMNAHVIQIPRLGAPPPPEGISYLEAANDFANRFNRAVFKRVVEGAQK